MHCLAAHTGGSFFRWTVATGRSVIGVTCRNAFACGPSFIALCTAAYQLLTQGLSAWRCSFHLMQSHRDTCIDYSADALSRACALSLSAHVAWSICDNGVVRMVLSQRRRDRGSAGMTRLGGFQTKGSRCFCADGSVAGAVGGKIGCAYLQRHSGPSPPTSRCRLFRR